MQGMDLGPGAHRPRHVHQLGDDQFGRDAGRRSGSDLRLGLATSLEATRVTPDMAKAFAAAADDVRSIVEGCPRFQQ